MRTYMRTYLTLFAALAVSWGAISAVQTPLFANPTADLGRVSEAAGGFSYVPPPGWRLRTVPGLTYRVAYLHPVNGLSPNINFQDETAAVSMSRYVQVSLVQLQASSLGFRLQNQSAFATQSGLQGVKLLAADQRVGQKIRCLFYFFPGRNERKIVVTVTLPASSGTQYDSAVNASMKTFAVK